MTAVRSNRAALLAAAAFFTFLMVAAHFYLATPTATQTDDFPDSNLSPVQDEPAVVVTVVEEPTVAPERKPSKPSKVATTEVKIAPTAKPDDKAPAVATKKPDEQEAKPSPTTADLDALSPQQWVQPSVKPDTPEYANYGAWPRKLPPNPIWTESLGKRLCIVDLESRPFDKPGQIWSEGDQGMSWSRAKDVHGPSGGSLNHWVYSKIHGYQYYYIKTGTYPDRRDSWKKPSVLAKILKKHDVCVFVDSDAVFNHLDLPLEWLMNYWSISPHNNSISLAIDPDKNYNKDKFGKLYLNTGFMIMQNNEQMYKIFKDWDDCANDGGKYPACVDFRNRRGAIPTDQGGFGTYIRYDYPNDIKELPCTEANGFPESGQGCDGQFIKHVWLGKEDRLKIVIGSIFPGVLLETFHKQFLKEKDTFFTTEDKL